MKIINKNLSSHIYENDTSKHLRNFNINDMNHSAKMISLMSISNNLIGYIKPINSLIY